MARKRAITSYENQEVDEEECIQPCIGPEENEIYENLRFVKCDLIGYGLSTYYSAKHRAMLKNVELINCRVNSFSGIGAVFDNVLIDTLRVSVHPVHLSACVFRHVTLKGKCGRFLFCRERAWKDAARNEEFDLANQQFYKKVDWALDISEMRAACFEIRGAVPARLIRRNPEQHFLITREVALGNKWKKHKPFGSFQIGMHLFLESGVEEDLLVPCHGPRFDEELAYFRRLKKAGLVE